ncbi:hypothetical protein WJX79_004047 [Trebouxia sp. C0005]
MQAAELQVLKDEYRRALQEPPWDGYCGLVKVSEDDSVLQPTSSPLDVPNDGRRSPGASEAASQQDAMSEPVGSPLGPAPPGMQFAEQTFSQPAAVTAGYSENRDSAEQLLLKLESLQTAEGLSAGGTQGQKARIAEEAFAEALQCLEQDDDNKQKADKLFQGGLEALNRGDLGAAMQHLQDARTSCPRSKPGALVKIQRFINLIEAQEKRTLAS